MTSTNGIFLEKSQQIMLPTGHRLKQKCKALERILQAAKLKAKIGEKELRRISGEFLFHSYYQFL